MMIMQLIGCFGSSCDLEAGVGDLLPEEATDCGWTNELLYGAWSCAVDAFENGEAFSIREEHLSGDSGVQTGLYFDGTRAWVVSRSVPECWSYREECSDIFVVDYDDFAWGEVFYRDPKTDYLRCTLASSSEPQSR